MLPGTTQAMAKIPLSLDGVYEEIEYFKIYLYIPSGAYQFGIQQGGIINAVASIISTGTK